MRRMSATLLIVAAAIGASPTSSSLDSEPPLLPSGMDLLYNDHVAFAPSGEPIVTIGIEAGQREVTFAAVEPLQIDFYEQGLLKRATVQAGESITVAVRRAEPAKRRHYVDLDGVALGKALDPALAVWRDRGFAPEALEEGMVLGLAGRVLDNRELRIVLPARDAAAARALADDVYRKLGHRAVVKSRLVERPWGELTVRSSAAPLGVATSFVRFAPVSASGTIVVRQVEHSAGYAWHGREDRTYHGELYGVIDPDGKLAVVNALGAEQVLESVVPSEMFASSPPEALRAQAIAARNHLLAMLGRRHHGDPFHLCAEQHCQVYGGVAKEDPRATAAVRATRGEALFHSDRLVLATYSSTCGGHTEDNDAVWGDDPSPALRARPDSDTGAGPALSSDAAMRGYLATPPATYCSLPRQVRQEKLRWTKRFAAADLDALLGAAFPSLGAVQDLAVRERGPGGRIISLELTGARGRATVLYELPIRQLFGNLSSGAFVIDLERDARGALIAATFRGAGWGHGVGMCQLGAIGRAEAGHRYRDILAHYYNGSELVRLYGEPAAAVRAE
jgi:stage II sporulation protein D